MVVVIAAVEVEAEVEVVEKSYASSLRQQIGFICA
jgi:hypothetical protein